jgi:hypothetical protein
MTAKEMLEALGYEYSKYYDRNIMIQYYDEEENQIVFWIMEQEFSASNFSLTVDEFKAIQKKWKNWGGFK